MPCFLYIPLHLFLYNHYSSYNYVFIYLLIFHCLSPQEGLEALIFFTSHSVSRAKHHAWHIAGVRKPFLHGGKETDGLAPCFPGALCWARCCLPVRDCTCSWCLFLCQHRAMCVLSGLACIPFGEGRRVGIPSVTSMSLIRISLSLETSSHMNPPSPQILTVLGIAFHGNQLSWFARGWGVSVLKLGQSQANQDSWSLYRFGCYE